MIRTIMIAAVALMLSAGPAAAAGATGSSLLENCREYEKIEAGQDANLVEVGFCLGYIGGVWDIIQLQRFRSETEAPARFLLESCTPNGATRGQVALIVIKHLKENPAQLHLSATVPIMAALQEAWPCPK
jgi:hypothetical protein